MTYSQALLAGKASVDASVVDSHGGTTRRSVLVVVVHDHKTRLAGHHCIVENRALDAEPEERLAFAVRG